MTESVDDLAAVRRFQNAGLATLGGIIALVGLVVMLALRESWLYFFQPGAPQDLGRIEKALAAGKVKHNRHVRFTGLPLIRSEGKLDQKDRGPGCLAGGKRKFYYSLLANTGDRIVVRAHESLKGGGIPVRRSFRGRLIRLTSLPHIHKVYRRFVSKRSDCSTYPQSCDKRLMVATDFTAKELKSKVGKREATLIGKDGHRVPTSARTRIFLTFRHPGEYEYNLSGAKKAALEKIRALGVPYAYLGEDGDEQQFIVRAPAAVAQKLIREHRRGKGYSISARTSSFMSRFGDLRSEGDVLIVHRASKGFPPEYRAPPRPPSGNGDAPPPGGLAMTKVPAKSVARVLWAQVTGAGYYGPREVRTSAFLLQSGMTPGRAWAALLWLILAALTILAGAGMAAFGLRRPG